jgi:hypothetical protein
MAITRSALSRSSKRDKTTDDTPAKHVMRQAKMLKKTKTELDALQKKFDEFRSKSLHLASLLTYTQEQYQNMLASRNNMRVLLEVEKERRKVTIAFAKKLFNELEEHRNFCFKQ